MLNTINPRHIAIALIGVALVLTVLIIQAGTAPILPLVWASFTVPLVGMWTYGSSFADHADTALALANKE
ncbi:hypothetical protein [uncultured Corynebacterium sp.]|uniref:hypothetical protein n=1 Tax=uncultured Corynebacterium sp. TaxID=159447 RepID=UPI00262245F9|nr:hypothetical protein [uncultured Corynebacterium sp.]